jgi:hypothetical protein
LTVTTSPRRQRYQTLLQPPPSGPPPYGSGADERRVIPNDAQQTQIGQKAPFRHVSTRSHGIKVRGIDADRARLSELLMSWLLASAKRRCVDCVRGGSDRSRAINSNRGESVVYVLRGGDDDDRCLSGFDEEPKSASLNEFIDSRICPSAVLF